MTEYVRQNKMCRYGDKNLSEVKKKSLSSERKQKPGCAPGQKFVQSQQQNTSTRHEIRQALPTKTPERHQDDALVVLLSTPNALHTQLQCYILILQTDKCWKC